MSDAHILPAVVQVLEGDLEAGSALVTVEPEAMGSVIGKGGANIKAIEKRFKVDVDLRRTRHQIRLRGEPQQVLAAKEHLVRFMCTVRITETMAIPAGANMDNMTEVLYSVGQRYFVQVIFDFSRFSSEGPQCLSTMHACYGKKKPQ